MIKGKSEFISYIETAFPRADFSQLNIVLYVDGFCVFRALDAYFLVPARIASSSSAASGSPPGFSSSRMAKTAS